MINEMDTMLGGDGEVLPESVPVDSPFTKFLLSPSYFIEIPEFIAVKVMNSKGEPFYLFDSGKTIDSSLLCGIRTIDLTPYDEVTECEDKCDGIPKLRLVCEDVAQTLFKKTKNISGLVFVSDISMQFFYFDDGTLKTKVFRVATDPRDEKESSFVETDYPVPYVLISVTSDLCGIVERVTQINTSLIDSLCRLEYHTLHEAENFPDTLRDTLGCFMSRHSHTIRGLLETQEHGVKCDDPFILRQRKGEIDVLVRLMMREIELVVHISKLIEKLTQVQNLIKPVVRQVSSLSMDDTQAEPVAEDASSFQSEDDEDSMDPLMKPLLTNSCDRNKPNLITDLESLGTSFSSNDC